MDALGSRAGEKGFEAEAKRLDLLELLDGQRGDLRAPARDADYEPFAFEAAKRMAHRGQADLEPPSNFFEAQALARRKVEAADLLAEDPIDAVLDGRDLERGGGLDSHR